MCDIHQSLWLSYFLFTLSFNRWQWQESGSRNTGQWCHTSTYNIENTAMSIVAVYYRLHKYFAVIPNQQIYGQFYNTLRFTYSTSLPWRCRVILRGKQQDVYWENNTPVSALRCLAKDLLLKYHATPSLTSKRARYTSL